MLRADQAHFGNIGEANKKLAADLKSSITAYNPVVDNQAPDYIIGKVEDMNVLILNSLWMSVPIVKLADHGQVQHLSGNRQKWSAAQLRLIDEIGKQIGAVAENIISSL